MQFSLSLLGSHQEEALACCLNDFSGHDRLQVHMACGTGKTRLGQAVAQALGTTVTLLLFPSLPLIAQTLESWIEEGQIRTQDILCVCSDPSVAEQEDDDHISYVPITVSTDPGEVREFFRLRARGQETFIFCTYHSLPSLAQGLPDWLQIDLCIFDEAHRVVGSVEKNFSFGLSNHPTLNIQKRLFMTATPRLLLSADDESTDQYISMSDETVFGPVSYRLSLQEAIERGIICDYQVIVSLQDDTILEGEDPSSGEKELVFKAASLLQTMEKVGARKAFTFHRRISLSHRFSQVLGQVAGHRDVELNAWHVDGKMTEGERHAILKSFSETNVGVVSCARCLSEGTNVPVTDLVAYMDARSSETDIIQTLGRALRKAPGKLMGYVLIPLRLVPGLSAEEILASSSMRHIWRVLGSIAELDDRFVRQLQQIRRDLPEAQWSSAPVQLLEKVSIQASEKVTEEVYQSLRFHLVDRLTSPWETSFGELVRYKHTHGNVNVSKRYQSPNGIRLGAWCASQRVLAKANILDPERRKELESIGFDFNPFQSTWDEFLAELKLYQETQGDTQVPQGYVTPDGIRLGDWCAEQRKAYRSGKLSTQREGSLRELGFSFDPLADSWNQNYQQLKALYVAYGSLDMATLSAAESRTLVKWLENQRKRCADPEKRKLLEAIGVAFTSKTDQAWDDAFEKLRHHLKANRGDHPNLGFKTEDGFALGTWVSNQRQAFAKGKLSESRVARLVAIGFVFNVEEAAFEKGMAELALYRELYGHCEVPKSYVAASGYRLGNWCANLRAKGAARLDASRVDRLRTIGFFKS